MTSVGRGSSGGAAGATTSPTAGAAGAVDRASPNPKNVNAIADTWMNSSGLLNIAANQ